MKLSTGEKHVYSEVPQSADDEESYKRSIKLMKTELAKSNPTTSTLVHLMNCTFTRRQEWMRGNALSIEEILEVFPLLRRAKYVSCLVIHVSLHSGFFPSRLRLF